MQTGVKIKTMDEVILLFHAKQSTNCVCHMLLSNHIAEHAAIILFRYFMLEFDNSKLLHLFKCFTLLTHNFIN